MRFPAFRVVLSAGSIAALMTLISAVAALAGDSFPPLPK
jgi:hypothetical protein